MVFTRLISTLAISGLAGALAEPVEPNASSPQAPEELTTVPSDLRSGDEEGRRLGYEDGELAKTYDLTDDQKQMFVDVHNHWRNRAALGELNSGKKAKQMAKMYWDEELAQHAKEFSRKCIWEHSMYVGWRQVDYGYGENLYATSSTTWDERHIQNSMDNWAYEHTGYNHDTLHCSSEPCGHYTAMVWEHTTRVGCAVAKCNSITGISWGNGGHYVICQYYRGGNYQGEAPYEYSLTTGDGCSDAPYGGSTGMDSQWAGLCNNQNDICTETNRCSAMQTCSSHSPLNGVDSDYSCSAPECHYDEFPGYQVNNPYDGSGNGMTSETGGWKYLQNRAQCEDWCYLNKDASPGCKGCTQAYNQPSSIWFPVKNVDQSVRSARSHSSGAEMTLLVLDCSEPGVEPTSRPTHPPVATPSPTESPTVPTGDFTCTSRAVADTEVEYPYRNYNGLEVNGSWKYCSPSNLDSCIEWCKANRYTAPCAGVTTNNERNPGYWFPVTNVLTENRIEVSGGILYVMDCTDGTAPPASDPTEEPTAEPTSEPTVEPSAAPTAEPSAVPTPEPSAAPTAGSTPPAADPTAEPTSVPTYEPTTAEPTSSPTYEPTTAEPTAAPTNEPSTAEPTSAPTDEPTLEAPTEPTAEPTSGPDYTCTTVTIPDVEMSDVCGPDQVLLTENGGWALCRGTPEDCVEWCTANRYTGPCLGVSSDTRNPGFFFPVKSVDTSRRASVSGGTLVVMDCTPTGNPTDAPEQPTEQPTEEPAEPTSPPTTAEPTSSPTDEPTSPPTTAEPTSAPTEEPTSDAPEAPTYEPTTAEPTSSPTYEPTTAEPTAAPTNEPSTAEPISAPTEEPTSDALEVPTAEPTFAPTFAAPTEPTAEPTAAEALDYQCTTVTIPNVEMSDVCGQDQVLLTENGGWALCRGTPEECVDWCIEHRYTGPCLGVSSDRRNPGFFFPVKSVDTANRDSVSGGVLVVMDCTPSGSPTNPPASPTEEPTEGPTAEPTSVPTYEPTTAEPTSSPTYEPTTAEPTAVSTSEPTAVPTSEPTAATTAEPTAAPAPTQEPSEPEEFACTTVTIPNVEIRNVHPANNGLWEWNDEGESSWQWCRGSPDECIEWCKANRFTAPCYGVTTDDNNPDFYFPVRTIAEEERVSVEGGSLVVVECTGGSFPPTPAPTNFPTVEGQEAKFHIGTCDHLEVTDNGNCVATKVYGNNHDCEITVLGDFVLDVQGWAVEASSTCRYDHLKLPNGDKFCTESPQGQSVSYGEKMEWHTDHSVTKDGWKICASSRRRQAPPATILRRLGA